VRVRARGSRGETGQPIAAQVAVTGEAVGSSPNRAMKVTDQYASEALERDRGRMFAIAYGMLGSSAEAEDVVQEAFVR
jgi:hypothetical protein